MNFTTNGTFLIKNFLTTKEVEHLIDLQDKISSWSWEDEYKSDLRLFGAERLDESFFLKLTKRIDSLFKEITNKDHINTWMLNKTYGLDNSKGSGGGWHRDDPLRRQYKFIIYLTDVETTNGPYQYLLKSNSLYSRFKSLIFNGFPKMRFKNSEIKGVINEFTGSKGDMIISDTCGIHRGKPLKNGESRIALTSYSYSKSIPEQILNLSKQGEIYNT
jgi:hypothetical protein